MARKERLVVIGGVAAGMSGASKAKRMNRELEVVVFEKSGYVSYGSCGFPYLIKRKIERIEDLVIRTPQQFAKQGIDVFIHHEVTAIDVTAKTVHVRNLKDGNVIGG